MDSRTCGYMKSRACPFSQHTLSTSLFYVSCISILKEHSTVFSSKKLLFIHFVTIKFRIRQCAIVMGRFDVHVVMIGQMEFSATRGPARSRVFARRGSSARSDSTQRVVKQREFKQWARFTVLSLALARYEYLRCIAFAFARSRDGRRRPDGVGSFTVDSRGKSPKGVD